MKEVPEVTAFKLPLDVSDFRGADEGKLLRFKNDPRFVVREITRADYAEDLRSEDSVADISSLAVQTKRVFDALRQSGLHVPVNFVVAENEKTKKANLYILTDVITRVDPHQNAQALKQFKRELRNTFKSLLAYYTKAYTRMEFFLTDVHAGSELYEPGSHNLEHSQYVYGKKEGASGNRLYLVDVDPYFSDSRYDLSISVGILALDMSEAQAKLGISLSRELRRCNTLKGALRVELDMLEDESDQ